MNTTELKKSVERYIAHLTTEEKALSTRTQYAHTIEQFIMWLDDHAEITKRTVIRYKEKLKTAYKPATVN
ncbi:MAG: integrase, partial [Christensenellaceae bacterium]